jgi:putative SOS response-associated peptidase YedK
MCGRFTKKYTWQEIHALYRLTVPPAIPNMQPSYNVCPTDPVDVVLEREGKRELEAMRWGIVPFWWSKPLKELRLATFNARVETVTSHSSASRSNAGGASCQSPDISSGRTRGTESSPGTLLHAMDLRS